MTRSQGRQSAPQRQVQRVCLAVLGLAVSLAPAVSAQTQKTYNFKPSGGSQSWNNSDNWESGTNSSSFPNSADAIVNISYPASAPGSSLSNDETLILPAGYSIGALNIVNNSSGATFTLDGGTSNYLRFDNFNAAILSVSGTNANAENVVINAALRFGNGRTIEIKSDGAANPSAPTAVFKRGILVDDPDDPSSPGSFIKSGQGTIALNASSNFNGTTTIKAGTLITGVANALERTSQIIISNGGTLLFGATSNNQINDNAAVTLAGGTLHTGGRNEGASSTQGKVTTRGLGALTLTSNSAIDLGTGASTLSFAASNSRTWTWGSTLSLYNWTGQATGAGTDQIFFGTDDKGLTTSQLGSIRFYSDAGITSLGFASILGTGEIVPVLVPEPATVFAGVLMTVTTAWCWKRARKQAAHSFA